MIHALKLSMWSGVNRKDMRRILRSESPGNAVAVLERRFPGGRPDGLRVEEALAVARKSGMKAAVYGTPEYPAMLSEIPDPPVALFWMGDLERFLEMPAVAVIGSRMCTAYGRKVAGTLAADFAGAGVAVVSGLARGIDGEAHKGALRAGGITMAVLGSGLDVIYPPEHRKLARRILEKGVIVGEYPPGTRPDKFRFPERNRLISGFSLGVVVVEAGKRSGTMITVNCALEQGREVFAVPGEITGAFSVGTNMLLRDGAGVVLTAADVLEPLGLGMESPSKDGGFRPESETGVKILELLAGGMMHFDLLLRATGVGNAVLQSELLALEMAGAVAQHPGRYYSLSRLPR